MCRREARPVQSQALAACGCGVSDFPRLAGLDVDIVRWVRSTLKPGRWKSSTVSSSTGSPKKSWWIGGSGFGWLGV